MAQVQSSDEVLLPLNEGSPGLHVIPDTAKTRWEKLIGSPARVAWMAFVATIVIATIVYYKSVGTDTDWLPNWFSKKAPAENLTGPKANQDGWDKLVSVPLTNLVWKGVDIPEGKRIKIRTRGWHGVIWEGQLNHNPLTLKSIKKGDHLDLGIGQNKYIEWRLVPTPQQQAQDETLEYCFVPLN